MWPVVLSASNKEATGPYLGTINPEREASGVWAHLSAPQRVKRHCLSMVNEAGNLLLYDFVTSTLRFQESADSPVIIILC